jgi:hypothetical protein
MKFLIWAGLFLAFVILDVLISPASLCWRNIEGTILGAYFALAYWLGGDMMRAKTGNPMTRTRKAG